MTSSWNLKEIYVSHHSDKYNNDMKKFDLISKDIIMLIKNHKKNKKDINDFIIFIETYIKKLNLYTLYSSKLIVFNMLCQSINSADYTASSYLEKINEIKTKTISSFIDFSNIIKKININDYSENSSIIKEHLEFLNNKKKASFHLMHKKEETLLSKFSTVSSDSWVRLYNSITSRIYSDFPYKKQINKYSLSMLREFTTNKSPEVRKKAFKAEIDLCKKISIPAAECLNSLKGESILSCQSRNFQSPLQRVLFYSRMKNETLYSLLDSIKQNLPKLQKYFKLKSKILNTKKALPYYDIFAPINAENNNFEFTDAKRLIINNFFSFSDDLGILAKNAFENNWIDAFPKKGKRGGAFCINLPFMKESRILTNFNNSFKDCITLAHELGHAYHNKCMTNQTPINTGSPMPLAETASIFAENIVKQNALKSFTENSKISIIEADLSDMGQKVIDIYSRFLFEEKIFKKREKNILSSEELCELMLESQIEAYGDSLDKNYLHPYMWIVKPHYYGTDFYNFPYAFGLLFAKGLFKIYKNEGRGFVDNYRNFLSMTNRRTVEESAKTMDIDVTTSEFWNMSIAEYVNDISLFAKYA